MKRKTILLITIYSLLITNLGCEAFVRKFTRKPKKENLPQEELVLAPEEYKGPQMTKEELYRQFFVFWKSWHDELVNALTQNLSRKKQVSCAKEAIKHLNNMRALLNEKEQKKLDIYINQLQDLHNTVTKELSDINNSRYAYKAERLKRDILRDFSYAKIKNDLL